MPRVPAIERADGDEGPPPPSARSGMGRLRGALNKVLTESIPLPTGNGHGNGHAAEPAAIAAGDSDQAATGAPADGTEDGHGAGD